MNNVIKDMILSKEETKANNKIKEYGKDFEGDILKIIKKKNYHFDLKIKEKTILNNENRKKDIIDKII